MITRNIDKIALSAAVILFLGMTYFTFRQINSVEDLAPITVAAGPGGSYEPQAPDFSIAAASVWEEPGSTSAGPEWVYDVFTPPVIFYDPSRATFTVTPPRLDRAPEPRVRDPIEVELVAIRNPEFRLQLVGYLGSAGDYLGTFESPVTGDSMVGRPGRRFPDLDLELVSFDVRNVMSDGSGTTVVDTTAFAVVRDLTTGEEITLTNRERRLLADLEAVFRLKANPERTFVARSGQSFAAGEGQYSLERIEAAPPRAVITRLAAGEQQAVTVTLEPRPATAAAAAPTDSEENLRIFEDGI
jgi:hypothetical protein